MILTGKAKEDFKKDTGLDLHLDFNSYDYVGKYAYVIEWLDSVDIYVSMEYDFSDGFMGCVETFENISFTETEETRQEATYQAITKANDIYNSSRD